MNELSVGRGNSIPDLPSIVLDDTDCEWERSCPKKYCDREIFRVLEKERCLILERARYNEYILTPYVNIKVSKITLAKKL